MSGVEPKSERAGKCMERERSTESVYGPTYVAGSWNVKGVWVRTRHMAPHWLHSYIHGIPDPHRGAGWCSCDRCDREF
ncbi:hypothetical protein SCLCIDRAFT_1217976 [Scleroderma citrinum Foug A]|uniref:Uncharacterized protein n=1 Tax=Scleroderma citrinum Foug A TaxID=1036808 RepID=A0A0C3A3D9_9AGAM|nr:hypothetical protein SCLCIDRAFT_1217976 [Scleroderma citrinum Foug A]